MKKLIIAIDGFSSCGKSTLAKDLARALNYAYIDSGAMYRATTLFFLEHQVDIHDSHAVRAALQHVHVSFYRKNGENRTVLNQKDVEEQIRSMEVSQKVSPVAAIPEVRQEMVALQRKAGANKGIVMDGRDIGTVVFPEAELKLFLNASIDIRVERRYLELQYKGYPGSREAVRANLEKRDYIDSTRDDSPLSQAADAVLIDNSNLSRQEQLGMVEVLAKIRMSC